MQEKKDWLTEELSFSLKDLINCLLLNIMRLWDNIMRSSEVGDFMKQTSGISKCDEFLALLIQGCQSSSPKEGETEGGRSRALSGHGRSTQEASLTERSPGQAR